MLFSLPWPLSLQFSYALVLRGNYKLINRHLLICH